MLSTAAEAVLMHLPESLSDWSMNEPNVANKVLIFAVPLKLIGLAFLERRDTALPEDGVRRGPRHCPIFCSLACSVIYILDTCPGDLPFVY